MPFALTSWRRGGRPAAIVAGGTPGCPAPAPAATVSIPYDCSPSPTLTQPFSEWADNALYTPLPGGNFESGAAGWTLGGGASVVAGNEPFNIGGKGRSSLVLPEHGSAVSAPIC